MVDCRLLAEHRIGNRNGNPLRWHGSALLAGSAPITKGRYWTEEIRIKDPVMNVGSWAKTGMLAAPPNVCFRRFNSNSTPALH